MSSSPPVHPPHAWPNCPQSFVLLPNIIPLSLYFSCVVPLLQTHMGQSVDSLVCSFLEKTGSNFDFRRYASFDTCLALLKYDICASTR